MRFRLMFLALLPLLTVGCGGVEYIRYLHGIDFDPAASRGLPLDYVYSTPALGRMRGAKLLVQFEDPAKTIERTVSKITPKLEKEDNWDKLRLYYERDFMTAMKLIGEFSDVRRATYATSDFKPDAILKIAVTEWHEGNKWFRAYLGFGFGATRVQWEGQLLDARSQKVIFAFVDARIHPGGPSVLGFPRKVWRGPDLITEDLAMGARALGETLRILIERENGQEQPAPRENSTPPALPAVPIQTIIQ